MECPICYDAITKGSGITTLSCEHSFHLKCIATWIIKCETCPCCRKEVGEYENIQHLDESKSVIYDDDTDTIDLDSMMNNMIQSAVELEMPVSRWIRMTSGSWVLDNPVPLLQLPPQIERLAYSGLNADAQPFYPARYRSAAVRIQSLFRGVMVRANH
jgi:hypothetical protein